MKSEKKKREIEKKTLETNNFLTGFECQKERKTKFKKESTFYLMKERRNDNFDANRLVNF